MQIRIPFDYPGKTPGANTNETLLFSTVAAGIPRGALVDAGMKRYGLVVDNPAAGSVYVYGSNDRGATWVQVATIVVPAPLAGDCAVVDAWLPQWGDVKVTWKNGGFAQSGWTLTQWLSDSNEAVNRYWLDELRAYYAPIFVGHGKNGLVDAANGEAGVQLSQWSDLSGFGYNATQATPDDQPTLGVTADGDYYLTTNAADGTNGDGLRADAVGAALSGLSAYTIIMAHRSLSNTFGTEIGVTTGPLVACANAAKTIFYASGTPANYVQTTAAWGVDTDILHAFVFDGSLVGNTNRAKIYRNGADVTENGGGAIGASLGVITGLSIGRNINAAFPVDVRLYSTSIIPRAVPASDLVTGGRLNNAFRQALGWH